MNFSEVFIRRPIMTVLLSASAIVAGVFAYDGIPIAALPQFDTPTIQVTAASEPSATNSGTAGHTIGVVQHFVSLLWTVLRSLSILASIVR